MWFVRAPLPGGLRGFAVVAFWVAISTSWKLILADSARRCQGINVRPVRLWPVVLLAPVHPEVSLNRPSLKLIEQLLGEKLPEQRKGGGGDERHRTRWITWSWRR